MGIFFCVLLLLISACQSNEVGVRLYSLAGSRPGWAFQGHLNSNERQIKLNPELRGIPSRNISRTMEICGFYIHHETVSAFPFMVKIIDKKWGNAEIRLKPEIKFDELTDRYVFQIEAYDCDQPPHFSDRRFVLIEVGSANGPQFMRSTYQFSVNSSLPIGLKIGEVTAFERPTNGKLDQSIQGICKYDIISASPVPFTVDKYGNLHSKEIVVATAVSTKYRFYVRATDCNIQQPRIASVPVIVDVYDTCEPHWTGLPTSFNYMQNKGVLPLIPVQSNGPSLHVCSNSCSNFQIVLTARLNGDQLKLASPEICKQDSESVQNQAKMCDASIDAIDLLKHLPLSMIDPYNGAYLFDGSSVPIDVKLDDNNLFPLKIFSLAFWMKHGPMKNNDPKQQILCNSDSQVMNRHHYSLFLHNCKLILLIRKEYWEATDGQYQPTEWRYGPLKEVCDNKWHHYALTFHDSAPMLQIDGEIYQTVPDQLIEKPLLKLDGNIQGTRLTVGSCFHSKTGEYVQRFSGHLSGMRLLKNRVEAVNTIRCMATCGEALLLPHIVEVIDADSSVTLFSQYAVMRSHNIYDLLLMFSKLSYVNTNSLDRLPNGGWDKRTVVIDTEIKCDSGTIVRTPQHTIVLNITKSPRDLELNQGPSILIYSQSRVEGYVKKPIVLFPNMKFIETSKKDRYLESCIIRPLNHPIRSWESLNWPVDWAINFHLTSLNNSHGLMLEGRQPYTIYELLLKKITFVTMKIEKNLPKRKFGLICAIKDRTITNEVINTVNVKVEDLGTYTVVDDQDNGKSGSNILHSGNDRQGFEDKLLFLKKSDKGSSKANTTPWVTISSIVFSFMVVMILCVLAYVFYYKKRLTRFPPAQKSIKLKRFTSHPKQNISLPLRSDQEYIRDDGSISSDCPESCDDQDVNGNEKASDDDQMSESGIKRVKLPKYIYSPYNANKMPLGGPVDV